MTEILDSNERLEKAMEADRKAPKFDYRVYIVLKSGYEMCIDSKLTESTAKRIAKLSLTKVQFEVDGTMHIVRMEEVAYLNITKLEDVYITEEKEEMLF